MHGFGLGWHTQQVALIAELWWWLELEVLYPYVWVSMCVVSPLFIRLLIVLYFFYLLSPR